MSGLERTLPREAYLSPELFRDGAWTFTASGTTNRRAFEGLSEDERTRHKGELIYPNFC